MSNFYDALDNSGSFRKFKVDDLLFVEYKCLDEGIVTELWMHNNFFSFIRRGKMLWKTKQKEYLVKEGEIYFVKKGSFKVETFFNENFCDLIVFVPDEFIKEVIGKYAIPCEAGKNPGREDSIIPVEPDDLLDVYLKSLLIYFSRPKPPSKTLLKLKFEELIINILSNENNPGLINYFKHICSCSKVSIREIMETNYTSSLSLNEFAKLCSRSLSTFKRDFIKTYNIPPGTWLTKKRLEYARYLLDNSDKSIYEIMFESGFKNRSHFVRIFKKEFGITPSKFKNALQHIL